MKRTQMLWQTPYLPGLATPMGTRVARGIGLLSLVLIAVALFLALSVPPDRNDPDNFRILYFHVPSAWLAYLSGAVVALTSLVYLWRATRLWDVLALSSAEFGVVMTTLTLATGSMWGYKAWGTWWVWDARLTLTLVMWLIFVGYLMLRAYVGSDGKRARYAAVLGVVGALNIPLTHFAVEWWRGQHPVAIVTAEGGPRLSGAFFPPLAFALLGFTLLYVFVIIMRVRLEQRRDHLAALEMERAG